MAPDASRDGGARPSRGWEAVVTYAGVYEAEIGRAVLEAGGFDAIVEPGERTGIFGPNFAGATAGGVRVLVPSEQAAAARTYLAFRRA